MHFSEKQEKHVVVFSDYRENVVLSVPVVMCYSVNLDIICDSELGVPTLCLYHYRVGIILINDY